MSQALDVQLNISARLGDGIAELAAYVRTLVPFRTGDRVTALRFVPQVGTESAAGTVESIESSSTGGWLIAVMFDDGVRQGYIVGADGSSDYVSATDTCRHCGDDLPSGTDAHPDHNVEGFGCYGNRGFAHQRMTATEREQLEIEASK